MESILEINRQNKILLKKLAMKLDEPVTSDDTEEVLVEAEPTPA